MGRHSHSKRATKTQAKPQKGKKLNSNTIIALLLIIGGLGVLLYPVVATQ